MAYTNCYDTAGANNYCFGQLMSFQDTKLNAKLSKDRASGYTELKAALTVTKADTKSHDLNEPSSNCPTNVGGPGDKVKSNNTTCCLSIGFNRAAKNRLISKDSGVDYKHVSYERYLLRKKGWVLRNQSC